MKITAIETIHLPRGITVHAGPIQWLWVRIHTDEGLVGLGETYPRPEAEKAIIHHSLAPVLLGRDPLCIDRLWADMFQAISYLSLIHISEPTRQAEISYAVFCLKKKKIS